MNNDLESALRSMMTERAGDITAVPDHVLDFDQPTQHTRAPRKHWNHLLAVAAAIIGVLAVIGSVLAIQSASTSKKEPPATTGPRPTTLIPTPRSTTASCLVPMPASWQTAIDAGKLRVDQPMNNAVAANAATGELLLVQGTQTKVQQSNAVYDHQELAIFSASGTGDRVYVVDDAHLNLLIEVSRAGALTDRWVVFGLRGAQNLGGPSSLYAFDRASRQLRTLVADDPTRSEYMSTPVVVGNVAYWLEGKWMDAASTKLVEMDLGTQQRSEQPLSIGELDLTKELVVIGSDVAVIQYDGDSYSMPHGPTPPGSAAFAGALQYWVNGDTFSWVSPNNSGTYTRYEWRVDTATVTTHAMASPGGEKAVLLSPGGATVELPTGTRAMFVGADIAFTHSEGKTGLAPSSISRMSLASLPTIAC